MRLHDALGHARRTRRIDDVEGPVRLRIDRGGNRIRRRHPALQTSGAGILDDHDRSGHRAIQRQGVRGCPVQEQDSRTGIGHHRRQGVRSRRGRQRHHGNARTQAAEKHRHIVQRGRGTNCDGAARTNLLALQSRGHAICPPIEGGIAECAPLMHQGGVIGPLERVRVNQLGEGCEFARQYIVRFHAWTRHVSAAAAACAKLPSAAMFLVSSAGNPCRACRYSGSLYATQV